MANLTNYLDFRPPVVLNETPSITNKRISGMMAKCDRVCAHDLGVPAAGGVVESARMHGKHTRFLNAI